MASALTSIAAIAGQIVRYTGFVARNFRAFYLVVALTLLVLVRGWPGSWVWSRSPGHGCGFFSS